MASGLLHRLLLRDWRRRRAAAKDLRIKLEQLYQLPSCSSFVSLALKGGDRIYDVEIDASAIREWLALQVLDTVDEPTPKWILANAMHNWLATIDYASKESTALPAWLQTMLKRYMDTFPTVQTTNTLRCPHCQTVAFAFCMAREFYIRAPSSEWYRDDYFCECGHRFHSCTDGYHMMLTPR